jgi:hypothetical protein
LAISPFVSLVGRKVLNDDRISIRELTSSYLLRLFRQA